MPRHSTARCLEGQVWALPKSKMNGRGKLVWILPIHRTVRKVEFFFWGRSNSSQSFSQWLSMSLMIQPARKGYTAATKEIKLKIIRQISSTDSRSLCIHGQLTNPDCNASLSTWVEAGCYRSPGQCFFTPPTVYTGWNIFSLRAYEILGGSVQACFLDPAPFFCFEAT